MRKFIIFILIFSFLTIPAYADAPKKGEKAPDFKVTSMKGGMLSLSSLKGKVVLMGMFHICVPCMNQAMEFEKVRKALGGDKLAIIGVNTNGDSKSAVQDYLSKFPSSISFPYYIDPGSTVNQKYVQRDMPTLVIIDKEGVIQARTSSVTSEQLIPFLKGLI